MRSLYLFYAVYFIGTGMTTFAAKFYGEIGLSDSRIGLITAVMALVGLFMQPVWGMLADRARLKRMVPAVSLALAGGTCFLVLPASTRFVPLLLVLTLYSIFCLPAIPVGNAIAIEYTSAHGRSFGPVRMLGTVGYQAGILITGFLLANSLRGLYPAMGVILLLAAGAALLLPAVQGHQHRGRKVPLWALLRNRELVLLLAIVFLGSIGHQFNIAFFSKHLGDLGFGNALAGVISSLSVALEIPFLLLGDRLMKRISIWSWLMIGLAISVVRFALLSVTTVPWMILLAQSLSIAHLACFEFFPMLHLSRLVREELQASAQSVLQMTSFGIARIAGSLAGGLIAEATGIPTVYGMCSALLLATLLLFFVPMRHYAKDSLKKELQ